MITCDPSNKLYFSLNIRRSFVACHNPLVVIPPLVTTQSNMCNPDNQALTQADTELSNPHQAALVLDVSMLLIDNSGR